MNSVRSLMGDVSFHGMATPPRCAMLREAVTHVAGLRCYPCRRTVPTDRLTRAFSGRRCAPPLNRQVVRRQGDIMAVKRMDNVGIVVEDIDAAIEFFTELGLELEGRAPIEGRWADG